MTAAKLSQLLGIRFHRTAQHKGNHNAADVMTSVSEASPNSNPLHFEIKRVEALRLYPSLEQAAADAGADQVPIVFPRPNRRPWICCFYLDDLLAFVDAVQDIRGND